MTEFIIQNDTAVFDAFVEQNNGAVEQTSCWAAIKNAWKPYYFMGYRNKMPVLSCLCLERKIPMLGKLWYAGNGFVCDFNDKELLSEFSAFLKAEMKKHGAFFLATDPTLPVKINNEPTDINAEKIQNLEAAGFIKNADPDFYAVKPTTDISVLLSNDGNRLSLDALLKLCEKGVRHGWTRGLEQGLCDECIEGGEVTMKDVEVFYSVISETADRVKFIHRAREYYLTMLNSLGKHATLDLICYDFKGMEKRYTEQKPRLAEIDALLAAEPDKKTASALKKEKDVLSRSTELFEKNKEELLQRFPEKIPDKVYLAAGITSRFCKNAICLYGGTKNLLRNTMRPTHYLNLVRIQRSMDYGCEYHSMGRVTGNAYDEQNPYYGLCLYKRSYNGTVLEYVGDMYLIGGKIRFYMFKNLLPKIKHIKSTVFRRFANKKKDG